MSEFGSAVARFCPSCVCTASLDFDMQSEHVSENTRKPKKVLLTSSKFLAWAITSLTAVIMLQLLQ